MKPLEELLIFSDLHAHNFKYGSKRITTETGIFNSRLLDTLSVLDEIKDYALAHGITTILFGGDLFHRRQTYNTDVFNLVFDKLKEFSDLGLSLLMIPGNHDYADRAGLIHALQPFEAIENILVMDYPEKIYCWNDLVIHPVPYTPDLDQAQTALLRSGAFADENPGQPNILLAHLGMQGARVGSDYILVSDSDIRVADVPHQSFTACFFGHYHEHQQLFGNGWFIGATHEHNWGDVGGKRGFLHAKVYTDRVDFKQVETQAPKFLVLHEELLGDPTCHSAEDFGSLPRDKDFVRVMVDSATPGAARRIRKELGREDIEVVSRVDNPEIVLTLQASQLDPESALAAWVEAHESHLDSKLLLEEGRAILREAREGNL